MSLQCEAIVVSDGVTGQCERHYYGKPRTDGPVLCRAHAQRWRKHGDLDIKPVGRSRLRRAEAAHVGYVGMHVRLRRYFGSPSEYDCIDCGREAENWALIGEATEVDPDGRSYSLDPHDYAPLCCRCHVARDRPVSRARRLHPSAQ